MQYIQYCQLLPVSVNETTLEDAVTNRHCPDFEELKKEWTGAKVSHTRAKCPNVCHSCRDLGTSWSWLEAFWEGIIISIASLPLQRPKENWICPLERRLGAAVCCRGRVKAGWELLSGSQKRLNQWRSQRTTGLNKPWRAGGEVLAGRQEEGEKNENICVRVGNTRSTKKQWLPAQVSQQLHWLSTHMQAWTSWAPWAQGFLAAGEGGRGGVRHSGCCTPCLGSVQGCQGASAAASVLSPLGCHPRADAGEGTHGIPATWDQHSVNTCRRADSQCTETENVFKTLRRGNFFLVWGAVLFPSLWAGGRGAVNYPMRENKSQY